MFAIRNACESDIPTILQLIRELADYERLLHEVVATEERLRENLFGRRRHAEVLLAEVEGKIAGFALFFHNYSTFLGRPGIYLEDLFVLPEYRRKGIGKAFFRQLARLAVARGCGRFEWSVLNWNEPALKFYRSLGAVPMSDWIVQRVTGEALVRLADEADNLPQKRREAE